MKTLLPKKITGSEYMEVAGIPGEFSRPDRFDTKAAEVSKATEEISSRD